jgi:DNA-binding Xre family transcriptional regulator
LIAPNSINPLSLPSVLLEERASLPTTPCIYFAIDSQGVVQYIGRSKNPRQRWKGHSKGVELAYMGGVRIAYMEVTAPELLPEIEAALIEWFKPSLNERSGRIKREEKPEKPLSIRWRLADVMHDRRISTTVLAEKSGINISTISKLKRKMPSRIDKTTLWRLCKALCCQPGDLLHYQPSKELQTET